MEVEVWDYEAQCFVPSWPGGEKRIRVDHHGSLSDLAVFEVIRDEESFQIVDGNRPLRDWNIVYS